MSRKKEIKFGLQMAVTWFVLLYLLFPWTFNYERPQWALYISGAFLLMIVLAPMVLGPVERFWNKVIAVLGYFKTRIIMGAIYLVLFIPVSLIFKLLRRDSMNQTILPQTESYKIKSEKADLIPRMERIF